MIITVDAASPSRRLDLNDYELTVTNTSNVYVSGVVSIARGQNIALFDSTGKVPLSYTTVKDTGSQSSFKITVPSVFLKDGTNTFKVISLPVRGALNASSPKTLTVKIGTSKQNQTITANDITPIEVPVEKPVAEPDKFTTSNDLKIYMSAADATSKINALKDSNGKFKSYKAGTYYVYKKYSGSVLNISTKQNVAGAWININDAIEETKVFHKGDIVGFVAGRTPYYSDGTRVPLYVIVEVTGKKKSPVISVDMNNAVTIYNVEKSVPGKYLEVLIPANDETLSMANQYADSHTTKAELTSTIESKYGSLKLLANCKGYKEFVEYMDSLLEDDVVIDTDTDLDPIMGNSYLTAIQLAKFVKRKNPTFDSNIANEFIERCKKYGVRGDVAFCQSILETGWFKYEGSAVTADQHNYAGLGVTSNGAKGLSFGSIGMGVEAQLQHLYAYATREPLPDGITQVDPRFNLVNRGSAPRWVDLNGKWSSGIEYGQKILAIYKDACNSL
jgi:hypothetical protein